jgi:phenylpyruvate tautomerase PptA (4-oxalocrotonate tautomerase family)
MPTLLIRTNVPTPSDTAEALVKRASTTVADALSKPEDYVMVSLEPSVAMSFGGSTNPLAFLELKSLGLPEDQTPRLSATLCDLIESELGIPSNRIYIEFASPPRHMFGFDRRTF